MISKVLVVVCVASVVAGGRRPTYSYGVPFDSSEESFESFESSEAQYNFNWAVQHGPSGNDFGHQEARDGDDTQGSYYVQLPDGRLQTVNYNVQGDSGYLAQVNYEGEARYPDSFESFESFEFGAPRARFFGSPESFESFEFGAPRARFFGSPESFESREFGLYRPPRPVYG
ncbi:uncharacterized protein [Panulirus ornatus]|uniref:uncharacterized protein n=1 Tax=Panulirus ornatus TaxID=150431 RepID=UPI003A8932A3